jgi:hypothetical protein
LTKISTAYKITAIFEGLVIAMTAEIVIMNEQAVSLAADSAVTARRGIDQKIFSSANKLFALSKFHSIGIMVYGNSSFMHIPWETLIKVFREEIQNKKYETVKKCAEDFIGFLGSCEKLSSIVSQEHIYKEVINAYFGFIKNQCVLRLKALLDAKGKVTNQEIENTVNDVISEIYLLFDSEKDPPYVKSDFKDYIYKKYGAVTDELISQIFEKLPISKDAKVKLVSISINVCCKFPKTIHSPLESGVVIAGFGETDVFPCLQSFTTEFTLNGALKYKWDKESKIGGHLHASIVPFAQKDAVVAFMDGIDPERQNVELGLLEQLFTEYQNKILSNFEDLNEEKRRMIRDSITKFGAEKIREYFQKMQVFKNTRFNQPVMNVIRILPKDELAIVAETFINLTSFKKRVSMESETVGGPIDVAVISKGDGFVWIKRKHYFKQELNPQFFTRYSGGNL